MSLRDTLTPEDRALIEGSSAPDLPPGAPPLLPLLQSNSSQLQRGSDDFVEGAFMGVRRNEGVRRGAKRWQRSLSPPAYVGIVQVLPNWLG
jgi:hypothetical protein